MLLETFEMFVLVVVL